MEFWFVILLLGLMPVFTIIALRHRIWPARKIRQLLNRLLKTWRRQPGTVDLLTLLVIATVACGRDQSGFAKAHCGQVYLLDDSIAWQSAAVKSREN